MINFTTSSILIISTLIAITNATGSIEVIITAPKNASVSTTICMGTECNGFDVNAQKKELSANFPLKIEDGQFDGYPKAQYDFHLEIFNTTEDRIGSVSQSVETNTEWQTGIIKTSEGFNVSYWFRTLCDDHYFGSQCREYCKGSKDLHTECTKNGDLKCMQGWTGDDCMTRCVGASCEKPIVKCPMCYTGENCEQLDVKCLMKHIKNGLKAKKTHQVDDKPSNDDKMMWMMCVLIFCVLLLTIVVIIGRREKVTKVEIVNTPTKSYKVYVIETSSPSKQGQHDPPPAYSPSPSSHKSLPTSKSPDHSFLHPGPAMIV